MAEAELTVFAAPDCPVCRQLTVILGAQGVKFRLLDVTADRNALVLLLRYAGRAVVPTVVAYGEVMVGFDALRLDQLLNGLQARADAFERRNADEDQQLRESEEFVAAAEQEAIAYGDNLEPAPDE